MSALKTIYLLDVGVKRFDRIIKLQWQVEIDREYIDRPNTTHRNDTFSPLLCSLTTSFLVININSHHRLAE